MKKKICLFLAIVIAAAYMPLSVFASTVPSNTSVNDGPAVEILYMGEPFYQGYKG